MPYTRLTMVIYDPRTNLLATEIKNHESLDHPTGRLTDYLELESPSIAGLHKVRFQNSPIKCRKP